MMKKLTILLTGIFAVAMVACKGGDAKGDKVGADTAKQEAAAPLQDALAEGDVMEPTDDVVHEMAAGDVIVPTDKPCVVDFNATWCMPCRQFGPVFHEVAAEYASKADFYSCDVDVCGAFAETYEIANIPTVLILYPDRSREPVKKVGSIDAREFKMFLDKNL